MHRTCLLGPVALGCWAVAMCLGGGSATMLGQTQESGAAAEQIAAWLEQLEDGSFLVREEATWKLIAQGGRVIEPLLQKLPSMQTAEGRWRGVFVLKQVALSDEEPVQQAAQKALERVAALRLGSVSQRAEEALESLYAARQRKAFQMLVRLGAKPFPERTHQVEWVYGLQLDNDWQGSDADVAQIRYLVNLQLLTFSGNKVRDSWLENVRSLKQLQSLSLNRVHISAEALKPVAELSNLKVLELKYVPVGDESIASLSQLKSIDSMRLYGTAITESGAAQLRRALPGARIDVRAGAFLGISGDYHSIGCLVHSVRPNTAAATMGLREGDIIVRYAGQRVGDFEALTALISKNRPGDEVEIHYVRDAEPQALTAARAAGEELGLTVREHPVGCEVVRAAEGSFAARGGLRPGDVIYRFNGDLLETPQHLQDKFARAGAGTVITFEFLRQVKVLSAKAKLGEWE